MEADHPTHGSSLEELRASPSLFLGSHAKMGKVEFHREQHQSSPFSALLLDDVVCRKRHSTGAFSVHHHHLNPRHRQDGNDESDDNSNQKIGDLKIGLLPPTDSSLTLSNYAKAAPPARGPLPLRQQQTDEEEGLVVRTHRGVVAGFEDEDPGRLIVAESGVESIKRMDASI